MTDPPERAPGAAALADTGADTLTVHATALLCGPRALLIRGAPGSGKSSLALRMIDDAAAGGGGFAMLVADDRVCLRARSGALLAAPPAHGAGLIELRGLGILRRPFEPLARVGMLVDLTAAPVERLPEAAMLRARLLGVTLPRIMVEANDPGAALLCRTAMAHLLAGGDLAAFATVSAGI